MLVLHPSCYRLLMKAKIIRSIIVMQMKSTEMEVSFGRLIVWF